MTLRLRRLLPRLHFLSDGVCLGRLGNSASRGELYRYRVSPAQESMQSLRCATSRTNPRQRNSGVSSHLPQNRGSFTSGAEDEGKEQDILLLAATPLTVNAAQHSH
jgi:hypothetical protein